MDESKIERLTKKQLLRQNIDHGINLFMIYVVTLSIFPGFLYENTGEHRLGDWYVTFNMKPFISIDIIMIILYCIKPIYVLMC